MTKAKKKPIKEPAVLGRPAIPYSDELAAKICRAIASSTDSLKKICARNPGFPQRTTIWEWRIDYPIFANMYNDAKRAQADLMAEEIAEIADDDTHDTMISDKGNAVQNSEYIARSRLRVETRKWIACKLLPKVYGDRVTNETTVMVRHEDALKELE